MSYDPTIGRWIEADPAEYVDGPNEYQMERSNPVDGLDPLGLWDWPNLSGPSENGGSPINPALLGGGTMPYTPAMGRQPAATASTAAAPMGKSLTGIKVAICALKNDPTYSQFGTELEGMLQAGKIDVDDLGFAKDGTMGKTDIIFGTNHITVDKAFAETVDCKNNAGIAQLAGVLVHEWTHWTTYHGNPQGLNWLGKAWGALTQWVPWWWDDDDSFRTFNEYFAHNVETAVRNSVRQSLKNGNKCCCTCGCGKLVDECPCGK